MTEAQKKFLDARLVEATAKQPVLCALKELLLGLGGDQLVAPLVPDASLSLLVEAGFVMAGPVFRRIMRESGCHRNVAEIWTSRRREIVGIGTGYCLSDDGLWRQHSWGIRREGILETTVPRVKYFGVLLQQGDADMFSLANLAGERKEHAVRPEK